MAATPIKSIIEFNKSNKAAINPVILVFKDSFLNIFIRDPNKLKELNRLTFHAVL
jgi:hypothetical protein